ncbi:MAG: hypothetical protein IKV61_02120 [Clostridia bacterium]|nr:hypothetical protein [Clostridia bacterium]
MKDKGFVIFLVVLALIFLGGCFSCGSCGESDGTCDHAGCSKKATTSFGGELELCLEHYIEWSSRATK